MPLAGGGGAGPGEAPPPYSPLGSPEAAGAGPPAVTCRVCQRPISVEGKTHQHVVKCGGCGEATVRGRGLEGAGLEGGVWAWAGAGPEWGGA